MQRFLAVMMLGSALQSATAQTVWGLPQIMQGMANVHASSADFTEHRTLPMLTAPLQDTGTLSYTAPDYLCKTTNAPARQAFVLDHDQVTFTGPDGQTHRFSLTQNPQIGGLIEGLRAMLAGDQATLTRLYTVRISGGPAHWQALLQPRDAGLKHFITWMAIEGSDNRITEIDTAGSDGSTSQMAITETAQK